MEIPESVRDDLESRANVVGTACGKKRVGDRPTDEECLVVLVSRKLPETHLAPKDRIPKEVDLDGERVKTDVQEVGDVRAQAAAAEPRKRPDRKRRWRPAPGGVSLGHPETTAGTMGSPVLEVESGSGDGDANGNADGNGANGGPTTVVLTNAHVAAPIGAADLGDPIRQPGPADGGTSEDEVGTLQDFSAITPDEPNRTDSALVAVDPADVTGSVLDVGELAGFTEPSMDATYTKSGRTTGVTEGDLRGTDTRIRVNGYHDEPTVFVDVDVFGPMSAGGDSGSLIGIEDEDGFRATHLLFAGSDRSTIGIPLENVQAEHGGLSVPDGDGGSAE